MEVPKFFQGSVFNEGDEWVLLGILKTNDTEEETGIFTGPFSNLKKIEKDFKMSEMNRSSLLRIMFGYLFYLNKRKEFDDVFKKNLNLAPDEFRGYLSDISNN